MTTDTLIDSVKTIATGAAGAGAAEVIQGSSIGDFATVIVQILIGIVTLWGLLKKKKPETVPVDK